MTIEEMKWKLYKVYNFPDWLADVESWDDKKTKEKYRFYKSNGKIK